MASQTLGVGPYKWYYEPLTQREFHQVGGDHMERFETLSEIFHRILTPLYGSQDKALNQIRESSDRKAFLLYENDTAVGVLVFKTILSNEFEEHGIRDSIEIKSLFVDNSVENSGRGLGSSLVDHLKEEVNKLGLNHLGIHVTVSETKEESLMFFKRKGFQIAHEWKDRYIEGVTEYLLHCPTQIQEAGKEMTELEKKFQAVLNRSSSYRSQGEPPELVHIIHNAHSDDIHGLKLLSNGNILSGSKDNCLYQWTPQGELAQVVKEVEPSSRKDRNWITAMEVLNEEYWLSGSRNGKIMLWKTNGEYVKEIQLTRPKYGEHVSHPLNTKRVMCLAPGMSRTKPSFFAGFPTMFNEFNLFEGRTEYSTKVHENDWVYAVHPLTPDRLLAITAGNLDSWKKTDRGWEIDATLIKEGKKVKNSQGRWQRPFLSSLTQLRGNKQQIGVAAFDGSVKIFDLQKNRVVRSWREHQHRVWMIENVSETVIASSGEDRSIRLWDVRQNKSAHVIADHVGQVSSLLSYNQNLLMAATCPENPIHSNQAAEIRYYDVRK